MHMDVETGEMIKRTRFEGKRLFKHDALVLMTATDTREWMKVAIINGWSIYSRWLLSETGLNNVIELGKSKPTNQFANWPPGNVPRLMSLDECANKTPGGLFQPTHLGHEVDRSQPRHCCGSQV